MRHCKLSLSAGSLYFGLMLAPSVVWAQNTPPSEPAHAAPQLPAPNPAAEQALQGHFTSILGALDGKAMPDAKLFTEDFNSQINGDQMKTVLNNVRESVGKCKTVAQMRSPISYVSGYLLECEKAYVPMEIAVEDKAPYRVQSLLIRPGFWKH